MEKLLNEESVSGSIAGSDTKISSGPESRTIKTSVDFPEMISSQVPEEFKGCPCFGIDDESEFMNFHKGMKRFHHWIKNTQSKEIHEFARNNPKQNFYVHHLGKFIMVDRSKKRR